MTTPPIPPASSEEPGRAEAPPARASEFATPDEPGTVAAPNEPGTVAAPGEPVVLPSESIAVLPAHPTGPGVPADPTGPGVPPPVPAPPYNPWAAPTHSVQYPPGAYPGSPHPAQVPPRKTSGAALVVGIVLSVLLALTVATVFLVTVGRNHEVATTTIPALPTTSTPATPVAQVGDCVKLSGPSFKPDYGKVVCETGQHNYVVSKVLRGHGEKCGDDPDAYVKYSAYDGRKTTAVCLIPIFVDGQCYNFSTAGLNAEFQTIECSFLVVRAKVLTGTVDKAACGPNPPLALAYPEIRTTYCFAQAG
ncbi:hypothetical protein PV646_40240 [Streptomyces sp. ID05-26A]|nr:hypothetical protein [Streptomyces sp. ID05-26A]